MGVLPGRREKRILFIAQDPDVPLPGDPVKKFIATLLVIVVLCALSAALIAPVAAAGETPTITTLETFVTPPAPEPTTAPTPPPTTEPTTVPTTTIVTTPPTTVPTTGPTITIPPQPTSIGGGKGWIDTYCNVNGATVYFDGVPQGQTAGGILSVPVSPSSSPVSTVTVSLSGYTPWSGPLPHMPQDQEHVAVYATLNPIPTQTTVSPVQPGAIYGQSSPAGASIYWNGNFMGYSPLTIPNLPPGTYSLKASLNGYTPDTRLITLYSGQTATYYPTLQPSPPPPRSTGTVAVTSNPAGALIYADGNYQGKAPLTVTLYPGSHAFRLALAGYTDYTTTVYVNANTNQNLNAAMAPAVYGTVVVTSLPGAGVSVDGNAMGTIPTSGSLALPGVQSGSHVFRVTSPGYNDWLSSVYILPGVVTPITATLAPPGPGPAPGATGGFTIVSAPAGAEIYIDNLFEGYTPASPGNIAPGLHQVLLRYSGYVDSTTTATVNPGQVTPLAISLQPAPAPTPSPAPSAALLIGGVAAIIGSVGAMRRRS